jgi:predicted dehydrogenase
MLRMGIAGIGFMGMVHYLAYQKLDRVKVAAVATRNQKRLTGDWRDIKGNFGPAGTQVDLSEVTRYSNLKDMIRDPDLDAIDICLPPALHAEVALAALEAGKHVFCEKPIALHVEQARAMMQGARLASKQLLVGHVLPFVSEYAYALQAARTDTHGRLLGGYFTRIISDPLWLSDFYDPNSVGGPLIDLLVHDAHFIRLAFGCPTEVRSIGRLRGRVVEFVNTQFLFDCPALVVSAQGGVINQQGRSFVHGFEIHFEKATLVFEFAVIEGKPQRITPLTVYNQDGKVLQPTCQSDGELYHFVAQISEVVDCIQNGKRSEILDGSLAYDALVLCQKQAESVTQGSAVRLK